MGGVPDGQRGTVVIVNDDRIARAFLTRLAEEEGLVPVTFPGAREALEVLQSAPAPDLIITDLHMPGLDGWGFCRLLRSPEFPAFNHTPILVTSATFVGEEPARITADLGANAFLPSPIQRDAFKEVLRQLLAGETTPLSARVLVVEDAAPLRHLLTRVFTDHGYLVAAVETGAEALERFQIARPDLVVLDFHLPDTTGDRVLQAMQAADPRCPVLVMTADPSPEVALKVMGLGARAYLRKPFDPRYLLRLCANARREMALLGVEDLLEARTQELRESETRLKLALEATQDALWDWDLEHRRAVVNDAYFTMLGFPPKAFTPTAGPEEALLHPQDLPGVLKAFRALSEQGEDRFEREFRLRCMNGGWVYVLARGQVVSRDEGGRPLRVVGLHANITEARKAAEALRASEDKLSRIFSLSPSAITISRISDGALVEVNEAFCRHSGYSREEALGHSAQDLSLYADPKARTEVMHELMTRGEVANREVRFRRKDGASLFGLLSAKVVELEGNRCLLTAISDITELHQVQEAHLSLMEQMRQLQKLESVGRLAGGVAHDFNNLLAPIMTYAELLAHALGPEDPRQEKALQIVRAGERGRDLTRQLLAFSRKQELDLRALDLRAVVRGFEKLLRRALREDIVLQLDLPAELPAIRADAGQVEQVLMNLAVNAQDAMPEGGLVSVGLATLAIPPGGLRYHPGVPEGTYVLLAVGDTGCGMSDDIRARVFEPFFTTKEPGKGTGLGLATVFGIVKQHGGFILLDSEEGAGTTFRLYFPVATGPACGSEERPAAPPGAQGHREVVLVVEDDPEVRESARQMLEHLGFEAVACEGGLACLSRAESLQRPPRLLLTDVVMPKLSGPDLHRLLKARQPDLPVVYMSGYMREAISAHGISEEAAHFLQKPFTAQELLAKIQEALASPEQGPEGPPEGTAPGPG